MLLLWPSGRLLGRARSGRVLVRSGAFERAPGIYKMKLFANRQWKCMRMVTTRKDPREWRGPGGQREHVAAGWVGPISGTVVVHFWVVRCRWHSRYQQVEMGGGGEWRAAPGDCRAPARGGWRARPAGCWPHGLRRERQRGPARGHGHGCSSDRARLYSTTSRCGSSGGSGTHTRGQGGGARTVPAARRAAAPARSRAAGAPARRRHAPCASAH